MSNLIKPITTVDREGKEYTFTMEIEDKMSHYRYNGDNVITVDFYEKKIYDDWVKWQMFFKDGTKISEADRTFWFSMADEVNYKELSSELLLSVSENYYLSSMWQEARDNIHKIKNCWYFNFQKKHELLPDIIQELEPERNSVICLRGVYPLGRNSILRQMYLLDPMVHEITFSDMPTFKITILPTFKVVFTGGFDRHWDSFNYNDKFENSLLKLDDVLDRIKLIVIDDPNLNRYNLILDGNRFQPYLDRFQTYFSKLGRNYFDLYMLDFNHYKYYNEPVQKCYYRVNGWNKKKPKPGFVDCKTFDNLINSDKIGMNKYAFIYTGSMYESLKRFLNGDFINIKHFMNKPLINP